MTVDPYTSKDKFMKKRRKLLVKNNVTVCPTCKMIKEAGVCFYCAKGKNR